MPGNPADSRISYGFHLNLNRDRGEIMERKNIVALKGNPLALIGPAIKVGDKATDFVVLSKELKEISLKDFPAKETAQILYPRFVFSISLNKPKCCKNVLCLSRHSRSS
jgi:peroxiredoxin